MSNTNYGSKKKGSSKFVIVAPHAAGDDIRTKEIAEEISRHLNSALVINERYIKPSNSRASSNPNRVEDFNKLSWSSTNQKYLWQRKNPHMKEFYDHIKEFAEEARQYGAGKAIVVYVHGMADNPEQIGIDIGFGAKYHQGRLKGTQGRRDKHPNAGRNTGLVRAKRVHMEELKDTLEEKLLVDNGLKAGIGKHYAAWSRQDGIQYHAGTKDHSMQLEISSLLRKPNNIKSVAKLIADALKEVYKT
mgnify:FL=1